MFGDWGLGRVVRQAGPVATASRTQLTAVVGARFSRSAMTAAGSWAPRSVRVASHLSWSPTRVGHCSTIDKWTGPTRADYVRDRHGVEVAWANEPLQDPGALRIVPDPASRSGRSIRTIGYSPSAGCLLTVITVTEGDVIYGVNSWRSNVIDIRRYREDSS